MSFASEVKKELLTVENADCCKRAMIMGILHGTAEIVISERKKIMLKSHLPQLLRYIIPILRADYGVDPTLNFYNRRSLNNYRIYFIEIDKESEKIIAEFQLLPLAKRTKRALKLTKACCQAAFIRGCFIAKGSINDPKKNNYHLEILFSEFDLALLAQKILHDNNINIRIIEKKAQFLLYLKKAEEISNFLAYVGASSGIFYFEDSRILRDLNNSVNRIMNCDIANGNKSLRYCQRQLKAISFLEEKNLINKLTPRLQDAIRLRKEYQDASLSELSELSSNILGKTMSKSGISHCLTEVMNYYKQVADYGKGKEQI